LKFFRTIETSVHKKIIFIVMRAPVPAQCNMHQFKSRCNVMVCMNYHLGLCVVINLTSKTSAVHAVAPNA
jgi:Ulp1 family protease